MTPLPSPPERGADATVQDVQGITLRQAIAEASASAAQWHFRIDQLIAHLDAVEDTIDCLADWEMRTLLRRRLKQKRLALRQAGCALTSKVRLLSGYADATLDA